MFKIGDKVIATWPKTQFEEGILAQIEHIESNCYHLRYLSPIKRDPRVKHGIWAKDLITLFQEPNDIMKDLCSK